MTAKVLTLDGNHSDPREILQANPWETMDPYPIAIIHENPPLLMWDRREGDYDKHSLHRFEDHYYMVQWNAADQIVSVWRSTQHD